MVVTLINCIMKTFYIRFGIKNTLENLRYIILCKTVGIEIQFVATLAPKLHVL